MVWWPSLWGSQQTDDSGRYRLVPSRWESGSVCAGDRPAANDLSGIFVPVEEGLDELEALVDARKTIDAEIARHRRLSSSQPSTDTLEDPLQDDDQQLKPGIAFATPVAAGAATAARGQQGEGEEAELTAISANSTASTARRSRKRGRTDMSDDASDRSAEQQSDLSCLSLADLDLQQDCFTVINNSPHDRGLEGCSVHSVAGGQVFTFPYQTLLPGGGGRITVWSGSKNKGKAKGGKQGGSRSNIFWTSRYIWNNHGDTAVLRGPDGEEELDRITSEVVFEQQAQQPLEQGEDGENDDDRGEAPESSVDSFLFLADLDLLQERVTICNGGADAVAMEGWQVRSAQGGQHFDFVGTGHVLAGGAQLTLHSGKNGHKSQQASQLADSTDDHLFWSTRSIWADTGDTAVLVAPDGIEVDRRAAKPTYRQHHESPHPPAT